MKKLDVGSMVRYVGWQSQYKNPVLYLLVGRTGVVSGKSDIAGYDWLVEMDEGCYDLYAKSIHLEVIDEKESDNWSEISKELSTI